MDTNTNATLGYTINIKAPRDFKAEILFGLKWGGELDLAAGQLVYDNGEHADVSKRAAGELLALGLIDINANGAYLTDAGFKAASFK